jgi:hypothetical protein
MIRTVAVFGVVFALTSTPDACTSEPPAAPSSTGRDLFATGPIALSSTALFFGAPGLERTVTVRDPNYHGAFTVSGCAGIARATLEADALTVTAVAANSCTLTIRDADEHEATIAVTVTTLNVQAF